MGFALNAVLVLLIVSPSGSLAEQRIVRKGVIARLNYGVVFRHLQPIRIVTGEWTHVFVMQLPALPSESSSVGLQRFNCSEMRNSTAVSCQSIVSLLNTLVALHESSVNRVRSVVQQIYATLPESYHNRPVRGLFDLGGQVLHSLFGVATDQQ